MNNIYGLLRNAVAKFPDKYALISDDGYLTYTGLQAKAERLAGRLRDRGLGKGDRVLVYLPNCEPAVLSILAAAGAGLVFTLIHTDIKVGRLERILRDFEPRLVITSEALQADIDAGYERLLIEALEFCSPSSQGEVRFDNGTDTDSDTACIIYTSGSTGTPKGVVSTHRNVLFATCSIQQRLQMVAEDVVGCFIPLSFDYGLYQLFLSLQVAATLALGQERHAGHQLLRKLDEWKVTGLPVVPSLANILLVLSQRAEHRPRLRYITNTGAHLSNQTIGQLQTMYPHCRLFVMFGLTECKRVSILTPEEYRNKPQSVGRPIPGTVCRIVDGNGKALPAGARGELVVCGPHLMQGYWRSAERTDERFGWLGNERALYTGDIFSMDEEGYLYFHGRNDDLFKQNGYRISSLEIETAAARIPGVTEAALLPKMNDGGSILFVKGTATGMNGIIERLRDELEDYKVPNDVVVVERFPYTPNGKIDKAAIKAQYRELLQSH